MRFRITSLPQTLRQTTKTATTGRRQNPSYSTIQAVRAQPHRFIHINIHKISRSAIVVQCASMAMDGSLLGGEDNLTRGWDAGVAVEEDDGG
ncbi:hypothetical protein HJC23_013073 [Cyclotella cryptica]|uniref:Uncharacterized protein n=1 Tax=Cyclotella cryptica TaxID=29204 RepID=A0ABD3Q7T6_9STRA